MEVARTVPIYSYRNAKGEPCEEVLTDEQGAIDRQMVREHEGLCGAMGAGENVNETALYAASIDFLGKGLQSLPPNRRQFWVDLLTRDGIRVKTPVPDAPKVVDIKKTVFKKSFGG
jgi:hypothetical protein